MSSALVGYTGFVGSNIFKNHKFDRVYNSKNIEEAFGTSPDLLIYAGVRAEKFWANKNPELELEIIFVDDGSKKWDTPLPMKRPE